MTQSIDSARLTLILNDLRLPAIKQAGPPSPNGRTGKDGPPPASSPPSLNTKLPNVTVAASSAISPTHACFPARPSTASTSTPCR